MIIEKRGIIINRTEFEKTRKKEEKKWSDFLGNRSIIRVWYNGVTRFTQAANSWLASVILNPLTDHLFLASSSSQRRMNDLDRISNDATVFQLSGRKILKLPLLSRGARRCNLLRITGNRSKLSTYFTTRNYPVKLMPRVLHEEI